MFIQGEFQKAYACFIKTKYEADRRVVKKKPETGILPLFIDKKKPGNMFCLEFILFYQPERSEAKHQAQIDSGGGRCHGK